MYFFYLIGFQLQSTFSEQGIAAGFVNEGFFPTFWKQIL